MTELIRWWLKEQDISPSSRKTYEASFRRFQRWVIDNDIKIRKISTSDIVQYKTWLLQNMATRSADLHLTVVRRFFKWIEFNKHGKNVVFGVKNPKRLKHFTRRPINLQQVKALLNAIPKETTAQKRDFALINLLCRTGLRSCEAVKIDVKDIHHRDGLIIAQIQSKGKTDKRDYIQLSEKVWQPIADYLTTRQDVDCPALFVSHKRRQTPERLTPNYVSRIVKRYLRQSGIDDPAITCHSLRHSFATNAMAAGAELMDVQVQLRHQSPLTTQLYLNSILQAKKTHNAAAKIIDELY